MQTPNDLFIAPIVSALRTNPCFLMTKGKESLMIVADFITDAGTSDSAFGGGVSVYTRSSRASQSDFEFSESYL